MESNDKFLVNYRLFDSWNRANAHDIGSDPGGGESNDFDERLEVALLSLGGGHDEDGGRAVVEARSIAGCDRSRSICDESWPQLGQGLQDRVGPGVLILRDLRRRSPSAFDSNRNNLVGKESLIDSCLGFFLGLERECILVFPRNTELLGDVFS